MQVTQVNNNTSFNGELDMSVHRYVNTLRYQASAKKYKLKGFGDNLKVIRDEGQLQILKEKKMGIISDLQEFMSKLPPCDVLIYDKDSFFKWRIKSPSTKGFYTFSNGSRVGEISKCIGGIGHIWVNNSHPNDIESMQTLANDLKKVNSVDLTYNIVLTAINEFYFFINKKTASDYEEIRAYADKIINYFEQSNEIIGSGICANAKEKINNFLGKITKG